MRLTPVSPTAVASDPFRGDLFGRKSFGERLLRIVRSLEDSPVFCLDAPWGDGKTTFVAMWRMYLAKEGVDCIYFDAFSSDYMDDPYVSLVGELLTHIEDRHSKVPGVSKKIAGLRANAARAGTHLIPWASRLSLRLLSLGVLKDSDVKELAKAKEKLFSSPNEILSDLLTDKLATYSEEKAALSEFREKLSELATTTFGGSGAPLVFIVDELDRCKPTYAIDLIEKVKHLFAVEGVFFLLVMHQQQLEQSIRSVYGSGIDAGSYLQKFIDVTVRLPRDTRDHRINDYSKFCSHLVSNLGIETWDDGEQLVETMAALGRHFRLSLRDLERCFAILALYYSSVTKKHLRHPHLIALLTVCKLKNLTLLHDLRDGRADFVRAHQELGLDHLARVEGLLAQTLQSLLQFCLMDKEKFDSLNRENTIRDWQRTLVGFGSKREDLLPYYCRVLDCFELN